MFAIELLIAGGVLLVTLGVGTIAHELSHAIVLRAFGIPHTIEWLPGVDAAGSFRTGVCGAWATVTLRSTPTTVRPTRLRLAAIAPLAMVSPVLLIPAGVLPDPFAVGNVYGMAAVIAWLGCALPSPRDFSLVWYAERSILEHG